MYIELSEVLVCPDCGPDANLVLMVDRREGRRVLSGTLACSRCDARYSVRQGVIRLGEPEPGSPSAGPADAGDVATEVAALLELHRRAGVVVLGPGLAPVARRVAALAERADVLLVTPGGGRSMGEEGSDEEGSDEGESGGLTVAAGVPDGDLPVRARRLSGVALLDPSVAHVRQGASALGPGGRMAALRPSAGARRAVEASGLEVVASEERAVVAERPS